MKTNLNRYLLGPGLTILFTVAYHLLALQFGITPVIGWILAIAVLSAYVGGFWASVICATWAGAYAIYIDGGDLSVLIQRIAVGYVIVCALGWSRRQNRLERERRMVAEDTIDKNFANQQVIVKSLNDLLDSRKLLGISKEVEDRLWTIYNKAILQLTLHQSYHELYEQSQEVKRG